MNMEKSRIAHWVKRAQRHGLGLLMYNFEDDSRPVHAYVFNIRWAKGLAVPSPVPEPHASQ